MIYFIQSGEGGPIKIGVSQNGRPKQRLSAIQTGNPLPCRLLGTMVGNEEKERELHQRFRSCHIRGEWFSPATELLSAIRDEATAAPEKAGPQTRIDKLIADLGGPTKAAVALGVSKPNVVLNWRKRGRVPADKVLLIEELTGVSRHELRADIFGEARASA